MPNHYGKTTTTTPRKQTPKALAKGAAKRGNAEMRKMRKGTK